MTLILLAVSRYVSYCSMLGLLSSLAAEMLPSLGRGVFLPNPRRTHPARVAVVALVLTGLVSNTHLKKCRNREQGCSEGEGGGRLRASKERNYKRYLYQNAVSTSTRSFTL